MTRPARPSFLRTFATLYLAQRRGLVVAGMVLAAITVLFGVALLALSGWFIAATAVAGMSLTTAIAFNIFAPSAGIRLFALGRTVSRYGERVVTHDATLAVLADLRSRLFLGWAAPQAARRLLAHPARLLFRLTTDIDALDSLYLRIAVPLGSSVAAAALVGLLLGVLDLWLGLFFAALLLAGSLLLAAWQAALARTAAVRRALLAERFRMRAIDLVSGQADLLMTGRLPAQHAALVRDEARLAEADHDQQLADAKGQFAQGVLTTFAVFLALLAATWLASHGKLDVALATLCILAVLAAFEPLAALRRGMLEWGRTQVAMARLGPRLQQAKGAAGPAGQHAAHSVTGQGTHRTTVAEAAAGSTLDTSLHLRAAAFRHDGAATLTLPPLDLAIAPGERVALVGASGTGKSTLLMALAGELAPCQGERQAPAVSWLTQRTDLFHDTIRANLLLADPAADDLRLWQVLEQAGLQRLRELPAGLDTLLGEGGLGLSAGQGRRLALARLLLRPVPVWLLDEPTESLDQRTAHELLDTVFGVAGNRTVVMATHLRREASHANRLLVLDGGRVIQDATREDPSYASILASLRPD